MAKKIKKNKKSKKTDDLISEQLERYMQIHKEHEKELTYIG